MTAAAIRFDDVQTATPQFSFTPWRAKPVDHHAGGWVVVRVMIEEEAPSWRASTLQEVRLTTSPTSDPAQHAEEVATTLRRIYGDADV